MQLPYIGKYALLRFAVPFFCIDMLVGWIFVISRHDMVFLCDKKLFSSLNMGIPLA